MPVHKLACHIWVHSKNISQFSDIIADMPLWSNSGLPEFFSLEDYQWWVRHGVTKLGDVITDNAFVSFDQLQTRLQLPRSSFYKYLQLRHAFSTQFPSPRPCISHYPLIGILKSQGPRGLISSLYTHLILSN